MNILITAIGSMSAEAAIMSFRNIKNVKLIGCDINAYEWLSTSSLVDTFYQVPKFDEDDYLDSLLNICAEKSVDFVIPLTDPEIDILYKFTDLFRSKGSVLCIPGKESIEICRDKRKLYSFFQEFPIKVIPTYSRTEIVEKSIPFPIIAKPRNGRSSEGILQVSSFAFLDCIEDSENYVFQPILEGEIVTVDYVRDSSGKNVSLPRKELIRTSNGAGIAVEIFESSEVSAIVYKIGEAMGIKGCVNMEFIFYQNEYYLMDINPRLSAGVAFSVMSGYDMCRNHLYSFMGKEIEAMDHCESGIYLKKYTEIKTL